MVATNWMHPCSGNLATTPGPPLVVGVVGCQLLCECNTRPSILLYQRGWHHTILQERQTKPGPSTVHKGPYTLAAHGAPDTVFSCQPLRSTAAESSLHRPWPPRTRSTQLSSSLLQFTTESTSRNKLTA